MSPGTNSSESRTLAEIVGGPAIVEGNSGWPEGEAVVTEMLQRCGASECLKFVDELEQLVRTMGISDRFSRDHFLGQVTGGANTANADVTRLNLTFGGGEILNEAGHTRATLALAVERVRDRLLTAFEALRVLRLDILATNMNDDGTYAAAPSEDSLRAGDRISPKG